MNTKDCGPMSYGEPDIDSWVVEAHVVGQKRRRRLPDGSFVVTRREATVLWNQSADRRRLVPGLLRRDLNVLEITPTEAEGLGLGSTRRFCVRRMVPAVRRGTR